MYLSFIENSGSAFCAAARSVNKTARYVIGFITCAKVNGNDFLPEELLTFSV